MTNALGDLLSPVDLADLLLEELVTALAELDDAGALRDPSCICQYSSHTIVAVVGAWVRGSFTHQKLP